MSNEALGETLEFITNVKLKELERLNSDFVKHSDDLLRAGVNTPKSRDALLKRLGDLIEGMSTWPHSWSQDFKLKGMKSFAELASRDSSISTQALAIWIRRAEAEIEHQKTRFRFAQLFGALLTDWTHARDNASPTDSTDQFEQVSRKETLEQKQKLESIIFEEKDIDVDSLREYLDDLFGSEQAKTILKDEREKMKEFSKNLRKRVVNDWEVKVTIHSVLRQDILSSEKASLLRDFLRRPSVIKELASVLTMQLASINSWSWPSEGVLVEPRRQLNGKTRFYLDAELLTALLLHYIGTLWAIEFRRLTCVIRDSAFWEKGSARFSRSESRRRAIFFKPDNGETISSYRRKYQLGDLFMCQLPQNMGVIQNGYDDESDNDDDDGHISGTWGESGQSGVRFDTPVNLKQSLLQIMSNDLLFNLEIHNAATVLRTDLEWFGPSLPIPTIKTVAEFFGMPKADVNFLERFLSCPVIFKDDPSKEVRVRKRGTPLSYMLSTLAGEMVMFIMDVAVNQRAEGLFLHRIHDDFWLWDSDSKRCGMAWAEMTRYAKLAGLTFNKEKTGSVTAGKLSSKDGKLPVGDVRWGFLRLNDEGVFEVDQALIDEHIIELRRQLDATSSLFAWAQAYNKYMSFIKRNCASPSYVYGLKHLDSVVDTLARVQKETFKDNSDGVEDPTFVDFVSRQLAKRFGVDQVDVPYGWYLWPNAAGGLEVNDPLIELFFMREAMKKEANSAKSVLQKARMKDEQQYKWAKDQWDQGHSNRFQSDNESKKAGKDDLFFSKEEFDRGREARAEWWHEAYTSLLRTPETLQVETTPQLLASVDLLGKTVEAFDGSADWHHLKPYWQWVIATQHDEMVEKLGGLTIVEPSTVPVGMISAFKSSKTRWEQ